MRWQGLQRRRLAQGRARRAGGELHVPSCLTLPGRAPALGVCPQGSKRVGRRGCRSSPRVAEPFERRPAIVRQYRLCARGRGDGRRRHVARLAPHRGSGRNAVDEPSVPRGGAPDHGGRGCGAVRVHRLHRLSLAVSLPDLSRRARQLPRDPRHGARVRPGAVPVHARRRGGDPGSRGARGDREASGWAVDLRHPRHPVVRVQRDRGAAHRARPRLPCHRRAPHLVAPPAEHGSGDRRRPGDLLPVGRGDPRSGGLAGARPRRRSAARSASRLRHGAVRHGRGVAAGLAAVAASLAAQRQATAREHRPRRVRDHGALAARGRPVLLVRRPPRRLQRLLRQPRRGRDHVDLLLRERAPLHLRRRGQRGLARGHRPRAGRDET